MQRLATCLVAPGNLWNSRQRWCGHVGEALDRFGERDAFGLHQKVKNVAVLAGGEIKPCLFLVIDEKRRRFLLLKRRQPSPLAPCLLQFHAPSHDFRDRKPGAQLFKELGRKAHGLILARLFESGLTDHRYRVWGRKYETSWAFPDYSQGLLVIPGRATKPTIRVMAGLDPAIHVFAS